MAPNVLDELLKLDYQDISNRISSFISSRVDEAGADGVVLGVSGGVDSVAVAHLAATALPSEKVLALILPDSRTTPKGDVGDAEDTAKRLGLKPQFFDISAIHHEFMANLKPGRIAEGNLRARIRMSLLYYHANLENRLVVGTGDRSEILIGYFTKYGDGGVDMLPIGGLYKTQVRELAKFLGVPDSIVKKPSSPNLWPRQTAERELGLTYEKIDAALHLLFDIKVPPEEAARRLGDEKVVTRVLEMNRRSRHKRITPEVCAIPQPA